MTEFVYTGSMTEPSAFFPEAAGEGIVVWRWNEAGSALERVQVVTDVVNPSWLAIDAARGRLYATSERHGSADGLIAHFGIDAETGRLTPVAEYMSNGSATCHVAVSADGRDIAWANYGTLPPGAVSDASLGLCRVGSKDMVRTVQHPGATPGATGRQDRRHAHCALFDTPRSRLLTTDLGLDGLFTTPLDGTGPIAPQPIFIFPPGSGPRHVTASPDFSTFYVVHELSPRIDVLVPEGETLQLVQSIRIGSPDVAQPAGIVLSPDGRQLFASVRGTDEIRGFSVGPDGRLALAQSVLDTARTPRDLAFARDGAWLAVACQDAGEIRACSRNAATGMLSEETVIARTGSPTCVKVLKKKG